MIDKDDYYSVTAALLWGVNYVAVKSVLEVLPAKTFLLVRFAAAAALLLGYLVITGEGFRVERSDIKKIVILGVLGVGFYNIFWTAGINLTTASNAALIISTSPLFTQLYMQLVNKEITGARRWLFTLLAFYGVFLIISKSPGASFDLGSRFFTGNMMVFVGALLFSYYTIFAKPLLQRYSAIKLNALAMVSGLPLLILFNVLNGAQVSGEISAAAILKMVYIIVFGTAAAYICWYAGIKTTGPVKAALFHYIVPVTSMVLGVTLLGEPINFIQVAGGFLALAGAIMARKFSV